MRTSCANKVTLRLAISTYFNNESYTAGAGSMGSSCGHWVKSGGKQTPASPTSQSNAIVRRTLVPSEVIITHLDLNMFDAMVHALSLLPGWYLMFNSCFAFNFSTWSYEGSDRKGLKVLYVCFVSSRMANMDRSCSSCGMWHFGCLDFLAQTWRKFA